jgi:hypothetical protein
METMCTYYSSPAIHCQLLTHTKDLISADPDTHGAMFVPVILGSDKTTVSVATGQHEYHPVYLSVGNIQNHLRRAHKDALVLIGFLPIPKGNHSITLEAHFSQSTRCPEGY